MPKSEGSSSHAKVVPELSIEAATRLKHSLPVEQSAMDSLAMFVMMFSMMGMSKAEPLFNWITWFVLLSMVINRERSVTPISQSIISLVITTISTGMLYYRMMRGSVVKA